ncbi:MAG: hypothetical protein K0S79_3003 [Nitrospira sp.]|nr:hypothetical protein [Nitrospira sp.]
MSIVTTRRSSVQQPILTFDKHDRDGVSVFELVSNTVLLQIISRSHFFIDIKSALGNNPALFFW